MKCFLNILFFLLISKVSISQVAQSTVPVSVTLPEIALLDIEPDNSAIQLTINAPLEAGASPTGNSITNAKFLNYSSAVVAGQKRSVYVQLDYGTVPAGITIKLQANASSSGAGALGSSTGTISLSSVPQKIISGIGGAYTGNGINQGHGLNYTLEVNQVGLLDFNQSTTLGVIYTLLDN